jgi:hypothetical protein
MTDSELLAGLKSCKESAKVQAVREANKSVAERKLDPEGLKWLDFLNLYFWLAEGIARIEAKDAAKG